MKLKTKIHLFSTLLMLVILALTNIGIYFLFANMTYNTESKQLQIQAEELTKAFSQMSEQNDRSTIMRAYLPVNGLIRIIDETGKSTVTSQSKEGIKDYIPQLKLGDASIIEKYKGTPILTVQTPVILAQGEVATIQMMQLLTDAQHNLGILRLVLFGVTLFAMIPIIASSIGLGRIVTQPIEKLIRTMARSRKSGTYEKIDVPAEGKDELALMSRTFNDLMEQLESNYKKQEQFVSNASHELKTPLTVIESYARLLDRHGFEDQVIAKEAVEAMLTESLRMREMIEQLLQLAKGKQQDSYEFSKVDISDLIEKTLQSMRQAYAREFTFEGEKHLFATVDAEKFRQLLFILLDNARKYSEKEIKTIIEENENHLIVSIIDYGVGIPEDALPQIFDRFYRVDQARSRKTGGTGLGLAIAKEIAEGLHCDLKIESIIGLGSTVRILIPKE